MNYIGELISSGAVAAVAAAATSLAVLATSSHLLKVQNILEICFFFTNSVLKFPFLLAKYYPTRSLFRNLTGNGY
jgi:hypothetical protein